MAKVIKALNSRNATAAKAILAKQETPAWGVLEHSAAVWAVVKACLIAANAEKEEIVDGEGLDNLLKAARPMFIESAHADGLGGNASQFRQRLAEHGLIPANKTEALADQYDDV